MSFEDHGEQKFYFLVNKWNETNETMRDLQSGDDVISVIPRDEVLNLNIKFYFSKVRRIRDKALENQKYTSNKFNPLIVILIFF